MEKNLGKLFNKNTDQVTDVTIKIATVASLLVGDPTILLEMLCKI